MTDPCRLLLSKMIPEKESRAVTFNNDQNIPERQEGLISILKNHIPHTGTLLFHILIFFMIWANIIQVSQRIKAV